MNVCTFASGPLDTSTFLLLAGLGILAIVASFRVETGSEAVDDHDEAATAHA